MGKSTLLRPASALLAALLATNFIVPALGAQHGAADGEWHYYGGDAGSTKYSPLDQINQTNVHQLEIAWRWRSADFVPRPQFDWQVTPLMVVGILYFTAGFSRTAVAADASTGETLWTFALEEGERAGRPARSVNRGLAYWSDGAQDERIIVITPGYQLLAIDARSGTPVSTFGDGGVVDLVEGLDREVVEPGRIAATSPAIVINGVIVVGAA